jgi:hypothetical protein
MPPEDPAPAARAYNVWPQTLLEKIEVLGARQDALRAEVQRAQAGEALTRNRLGLALADALLARSRAEADARAAALAHWRGMAADWSRPDRRNRLRRQAEKALARLGARGGALIIAASGLWAEGGQAEIQAYVSKGCDPTAQPRAIFDQAWYLERYPDVAATGRSPLVHYLLSGGAEGRWPHPLFDPDHYVGRNGVDLGVTGLTPLEHYVRLGAAQGFDPHPLFRTDHYLVQAPDLFGRREAPLAHYLRVGAGAGLSPHPLFKPELYAVQAGPDAGALGLPHFLTTGSAAGFKPHPLFDPAWFAATYPQVQGEALSHFVRRGGPDTLSPGPWLDGPHYVAARGDARPSELDPLTDYLQGGAWAVGEPSPGFWSGAYLTAHPELASQGLTPLERWASLGRLETSSAQG